MRNETNAIFSSSLLEGGCPGADTLPPFYLSTYPKLCIFTAANVAIAHVAELVDALRSERSFRKKV